jgi:predicted nucleic acid-binding protein
MQSIIIWAGVIGSVLGIFTSSIAIASLYRGSVRKGYAAEREFLHIKESFQSLTYNIDFLTKEIDRDVAELAKENDRRFDRIDQNQLEIKALLLANLGIKPKHTE